MNELHSQGYVVIRDIIDAQQICAMRNAINETVDRVAKSLRAPFEMSCPAAELEDRLDRIWRQDRSYAHALFHAALADSQRDDRIQAISSHVALSLRVAELIAPLRRFGQTIRVRAAVPAFSDAVSRWHQDVPGLAANGCGSVRLACWIPLTNVDPNTGALEVIPGNFDAPLPHEGDPDGRFFIEPGHIPQTGRRIIPLRSGDVLILNRFTPHRSLPVQHRARWAVVMWIKAEVYGG